MTAQFSECLHYRGEDLSLCSEPLGHYLKTVRQDFELEAPSTALWRGYVGTWTIENKHLYLVKLQGYRATASGTVEIGLGDLFPDFPDGVFAHWYTGELRCPMGGLLDYVHGGYASIYEKDLFLRFEKGILISERIVENGLADPNSTQGYRVSASLTLGS
jgi:hypothetical protein